MSEGFKLKLKEDVNATCLVNDSHSQFGVLEASVHLRSFFSYVLNAKKISCDKLFTSSSHLRKVHIYAHIDTDSWQKWSYFLRYFNSKFHIFHVKSLPTALLI